MEDILDMNIFEINGVFTEKEFNEFCSSISAIQAYHESTQLILEAVEDPNIIRKGKINRVVKNTKDIADLSGKAVGGIIDAKAAQYNAIAKLGLTMLNGVIKIILFVANKVSGTINSVNNFITSMGKFPERLRNKIKGNIELYITAADIQLIYNQAIMAKLDNFITDFSKLTKGDMWKTMFDLNRIKHFDFNLYNSDVALARKIHKDILPLKNVNFTTTVIDISNENNRNIYFGTVKISWVDSHGKKEYNTYGGAILYLLEVLEKKKANINELQEAFGDKKTRSELNQNWAMLGNTQRDFINQAIEDASDALGVIANIVKCINIDMNTLQKKYTAILKSEGNK